MTDRCPRESYVALRAVPNLDTLPPPLFAFRSPSLVIRQGHPSEGITTNARNLHDQTGHCFIDNWPTTEDKADKRIVPRQRVEGMNTGTSIIIIVRRHRYRYRIVGACVGDGVAGGGWGGGG